MDFIYFLSIIPASSKQSKKAGPSAVWRSDVTVAGYQKFDSMSFVTPTEFWMRNVRNLFKINATGKVISNNESLKIEKEYVIEAASYHTVTQTGELLFLGDKHIKKLTSEGTVETFITGDQNSNFTAICSCSNGDILAATVSHDEYVKILRYCKEENTQVIQKDDEGNDIYKYNIVYSIAESKKNQDILTSGVSRVIGVEKTGRYKFLYTGHFSERDFRPHCISTDNLGQICVGQSSTKASSIHLLTEDGYFLCFLLTNKIDGIHSPLSIGVNETDLYVLCENSNRISVYDYQSV
jgi:hypothetical protein